MIVASYFATFGLQRTENPQSWISPSDKSTGCL